MSKRHSEFSSLTMKADVAKVLEHPELVLNRQADEIYLRTGVNTNAKCLRLEKLMNRLTQQTLSKGLIDDPSAEDLRKRLTNKAASNVPKEGQRSRRFEPEGLQGRSCGFHSVICIAL